MDGTDFKARPIAKRLVVITRRLFGSLLEYVSGL